jgi:plasmid stabilization system protein ParE
MIRKVKLSRRASKKLDKLLLYLETEWSVKVKNAFIKKFDKSLSLIQDNPKSFPKYLTM